MPAYFSQKPLNKIAQSKIFANQVDEVNQAKIVVESWSTDPPPPFTAAFTARRLYTLFPALKAIYF